MADAATLEFAGSDPPVRALAAMLIGRALDQSHPSPTPPPQGEGESTER